MESSLALNMCEIIYVAYYFTALYQTHLSVATPKLVRGEVSVIVAVWNISRHSDVDSFVPS